MRCSTSKLHENLGEALMLPSQDHFLHNKSATFFQQKKLGSKNAFQAAPWLSDLVWLKTIEPEHRRNAVSFPRLGAFSSRSSASLKKAKLRHFMSFVFAGQVAVLADASVAPRPHKALRKWNPVLSQRINDPFNEPSKTSCHQEIYPHLTKQKTMFWWTCSKTHLMIRSFFSESEYGRLSPRISV